MLVIPLAAFDGNHAVFKVYVIAFQAGWLRSSSFRNYTVSERNTGSVMRWIAASLPRLGFMLSQASKKRFNSSCVKGCGV